MSDARQAKRRANRDRGSGNDSQAAGSIAAASSNASETSSPGWIVPATLILAALCLLGLFSTEITDTDFWWHLKTGQYIVQTHKLPVPDPFAYTTSLSHSAYPGEEQVRHFNLTHEWLSQALLYLIYLVGGFPGVVLMRAALLGGICAMGGILAFWRSNNLMAGIAAAAATAVLATDFRADRPALVTFLFVGVFLVILESRRGWWLLPLLGWIWANAHGGFFLSWVVLGAYCADSLPIWPAWMPRITNPEDRKRLWIISVATVAATLLNPNGIGVLSTLIQYRKSPMQASLIEWQSPYLWGPPYLFDVLLYAAAGALLLSWRRVRIGDWILFIAFAAAALTAFRNILLVGLLAPVLIVSYFPWKLSLPPVTKYAVPAILALVLVAGTVRGSFFQLRAAMWKFPTGAADFILTNHITAPLYNTYEHGGYLMWRLWPQERVFIDGRSLSDEAFRDYRQILYNESAGVDKLNGPRAALLQKYGIDVVVMNTFEYVSGSMYPLAVALAGAPGWKLVYDDPQSLIFVRSPGPATEDAEGRANRVFDHMANECLIHIANSPDTPRCARTLADYWMRAGNKIKARGLLRAYLSHVTEKDPNAEQALEKLNSP